MSENTLDRKDLKILAYKEKVAELEERVADSRVDYTIAVQRVQELESESQSLRDEVQRLQNQLNEYSVDAKSDPVVTKGEVVDSSEDDS